MPAVLIQAAVLISQALLPRTGGSSGLSQISSVVTVVVTAGVTGLLLTLLDGAVRGRALAPLDAWTRIGARIGGLVGLSVVITLIIAVPAGVLLLVLIMQAFSGGNPAVVIGLGVVIAVVVAYVAVLFSLAPPAFVVEGLGVLAALRRTARLVTGAWWRTFGILLVAVLVVVVPFAALVAIVGPGRFVGTDPGVFFGSELLISVVSVVVSTVATPFVVGITGLLHVEQRIRRERFVPGVG